MFLDHFALWHFTPAPAEKLSRSSILPIRNSAVPPIPVFLHVSYWIPIPACNLPCHTYCLAIIAGDYCFDKNEKDKLYHHRNIEILEKDIPKTAFSQQVIYSLGAFRTIFKAKHEDEILKIINKWKEGRK